MIRWVFRYYMYQLKKLDKDGTFKHVVALLTCIGECCLDWYGQVSSVMYRGHGLEGCSQAF